LADFPPAVAPPELPSSPAFVSSALALASAASSAALALSLA
tara:strand:- start:742 stop:864 length:123 start_codon:yes stop_codon:yes gene_type:complete